MNSSLGLTRVQLAAPYLIFIGDADRTLAKTGLGIVKWRPELVAGQLRFPGCETDLGVPDMTIAQAAGAGVRSLVVGVAPTGGGLSSTWWAALEEAAAAGMDVVSGLHFKLNDRPSLVELSTASGGRLVDVRVPPVNLPIGSHRKRSGKRLLMVGTDCAIGKKYTALAMTEALNEAGYKATFRATGQTGIMIAGEGIPLDAVVADFISGAAELVSPDNESSHWDVIEGQGSLSHPGYAGVSLGLLHGSQPDAFILCHEAHRTVSDEGHCLLSIAECIRQTTLMGRLTNPDIRCLGISVNTSALSLGEREAYLTALASEHGLPCVDPLVDGCDPLVAAIS